MSLVSDIFSSGMGLGQITSTLMKGHGHVHHYKDDNQGEGKGVERSNRFANAIFQALQQMGVPMDKPVDTVSSTGAAPSTDGVTPTSTTTDTANAANAATASNAPSQDIGHALKSFLMDLFDALQSVSNNGSGTKTGSDGDGDNDGSMIAGAVGEFHAKYKDGGGIDIKLGVLIQQLSSGNADPTAQGSNILASLQQDFQNLMNSFGATNKNANLPDFLKTIADSLHGSNPGLNVDSKA